MKTILIDACNTLFTEEGINTKIKNILDSFENEKIVISEADDEQLKKFGVDKSPYRVFTLKHNPDKKDPVFYKLTFRELELDSEDVVYIEHDEEAVETARKTGIKTFYYDKDKKDLDELKMFLQEQLM